MSALRQALRRSFRLQDLYSGSSLSSLDSSVQAAVPFVGQQMKSFTSSTAYSAPVHIEDELYCRQRQLLVLGNRVPVLAPDTWIAPNAVVIGDVDLFDQVILDHFKQERSGHRSRMAERPVKQHEIKMLQSELNQL